MRVKMFDIASQKTPSCGISVQKEFANAMLGDAAGQSP